MTDGYVAYHSMPGFLPDTDEPSALFSTATDAWDALIEDAQVMGLGWEPDDEEDPEGPQSITRLVEKMQDARNYYGLDSGRVGSVYDEHGRVWTVEYYSDDYYSEGA